MKGRLTGGCSHSGLMSSTSRCCGAPSCGASKTRVLVGKKKEKKVQEKSATSLPPYSPADGHSPLRVLDIKDPEHQWPVRLGDVKGKVLVPHRPHAVGRLAAHLGGREQARSAE